MPSPPLPGLAGKKRSLRIDLNAISHCSANTPLSVPDGTIRFKRRIGAGSEGEVYLGEALDGQPVAVKVITQEAQPRLQSLHGMKRRLHHPNIISHHRMQFDGAYGYVEMELCETDLLKKIVGSREGRLPESESFLLFYQLARAVRHCHSQGIYHRDIKPENVLIKGGLQVKLTDFGTALSLPGPTNAFEYDGFAPGSPSYLAPELLRLPGNNHPHSLFNPGLADVWSLGATLFAMIAGRTPWNEDIMPEEQEMEVCCPAPYREQDRLCFPNGLSEDLKELLRGMLALDPAHRLSLDAVWSHRWMRKQAKIFSASMTCYNHSIKAEQPPHVAGAAALGPSSSGVVRA